MQDVVNQLTANPLFSVVLALLALLLIFLVLKSLFRIALFMVAVFALYAGYVYFFQEKYPLPHFEVTPEALNQLTEKVGNLIPDLNISVLDSNFTRSPKGD
jgi:ABC-type multidrug transport system fused ATPase/permease subunit